MMWTEGVGWLGGWPTCKGTNARNQCQEPLVSCDCRAWIEATSCSPRREIRAAKGRGTNAGTADGEPCRSCNHTAWDRELDLKRKLRWLGSMRLMSFFYQRWADHSTAESFKPSFPVPLSLNLSRGGRGNASGLQPEESTTEIPSR